ncbi:YegP family protein [Pseudoalteromonas aliena]|uniref:YegP family protein n=1 Tax=Pseudoalteromonas aliena TaxID=247523 RepID=UPI00311D858B
MSKFEIFTGTDNQFYFRLKASNSEIILKSEGYTTKQNCHNGIDSVKLNAPADPNYDRLTSTNDKYYFNLKSAHNHQIIGTSSEMYESAQGRDKGIESVKSNAPKADVVDLT